MKNNYFSIRRSNVNKTASAFKTALLTFILLTFAGFNNASAQATISLTSAVGTDAQVVCLNDQTIVIDYTIGGTGTGAGAVGLPPGSVYNFTAGVFHMILTSSQAGLFNYTVTTTGSGTQATATGSITINPMPALSSSLTPPAICSGASFNYTPTSGTSNTLFSWTRAVVSGISNIAGAGIGNPNETLLNTTAFPLNVTYVFTVSANGCINPTTFSVVITVQPSPTLSSTLTPAAICNGSVFNYSPSSLTSGASFLWTRVAVTGISNSSGSGSGNPGEILVNISPAPINVTYAYAISANGCSSNQNVIVTVNPTPTLNSSLTPPAICSGSAFNYLPTSLTAGAIFTWTRAIVSGISNSAGSGSFSPNEILTNTTVSPVNVTYVYTIISNGCINPTTYNVLVAVNPTPCTCNHSLSSSLTPPAICSSSAFNYTPTSSTGDLFSWVRVAVSGISNASASGTNNPNETLVNTTSAPINVTYIYSVGLTGDCTNPITFSVIVTVNPTVAAPFAAAASNITCTSMDANWGAVSGAVSYNLDVSTSSTFSTFVGGYNNLNLSNVTTYNIIGLTPNTTYYYRVRAMNACSTSLNSNTITTGTVGPVSPTATAASNITCTSMNANWGAVSSATAYFLDVSTSSTFSTFVGSYNNMNIGNVTTFNITGLTVNTTYYYRVRAANGCSTSLNSNTITESVSSPAAPTATAASNFTCTSFNANWASVSGATTYFLDVATDAAFTSFVTGYSNLNLGNITTYNITGLTANISYYYRVRASNSCSTSLNSNTITCSTTSPALSSTLTPAAICSGTAFNYTPTSGTSNAAFAWTRALVIGISNGAASGTGNPLETLISTAGSPINVTYVYTVTANGCTNPTTYNVVVTVNPTPCACNHSLSSSLTPPAICSGSAFNYTPTSTTGDIFSWSRAVVVGISNGAASGSNNPNEILVNTSTAPVNVTYVYSVGLTGDCTNSTTFSVVVTVNPTPLLSSASIAPAICSGTAFNYLPTSLTLGAAFTWTRAIVSGISNSAASGTGNPLEALTNTTASPVNVTYVYTVTANGCTNSTTYIVVVTVNPTPCTCNHSLNSSLTPPAICSGSAFNYTPTSSTGDLFSWTRTLVAGISNGAASGSNNPNEILINTTSSLINVTYVYSVGLTGDCTNSATFSVVVTVYPTVAAPIAAAASNISCTSMDANWGTVFGAISYSLDVSTSPTFSTFVSGYNNLNTGNVTTYNITGLTPNFTYYYRVRAMNACSTSLNSNTITVGTTGPNPPTATAASNFTCTSMNANWTAVSGAAGYFIDVATDAAFSTFVSGYNNLNVGNATTFNLAGLTLNTTYYYRVRATNGCSTSLNSNTVSEINSAPALNSSLTPPAICSGSIFVYVPTSSTTGATFTWTRAIVSGISNLAAVGTGNPNEALANTTASPINVVYVYTVTANGCTNPTTYNVVVTINPTPCTCSHSLSSSLTPPAVCSGTAFNYTPTSSTGDLFLWTRAAVTDISNSAGSGTDNPNEILINTSTAPVNVTYVYSVGLAGDCTNSTTFSVVVSVNPAPVLTSSTTAPAVCSGIAFNYAPSSTTAGTTFAWTRAIVSGISNNANSGSGNPNETLINTTVSSVNVTYVYTLTANGCTNPTAYSVVAAVNSFSIAPASASANSTSISLGDSTLVTENGGSLGTGGSYNWYAGSCGGTFVGSGSSIYVTPTVTSTYYVRAQSSCNTTSCTSVTITVNAAVWPGDANNDSLVDNTDLLAVGLFYSQTGTPRASVSNTWQAYSSANWGALQTNGQDIKHADCNGDGIIDANDTAAINLNFNLLHAIVSHDDDNNNINQIRTTSDMYFVINGSSFTAGDWVDAELWLGISSAPISSLYGISFNINYDASLVQSGTESITYPSSWLGTPGTDAVKIGKIDNLANTAYGAVSRIDHINANGFGKIADFKFQIKTSLNTAELMLLSVSNYSANDSAGLAQVFNLETDSVSINQTVGIHEVNTASGITISPNPFTSQTTISFTKEMKNASVKIMDIAGKEVKNMSFSGNKFILEKGELAAGVYFVKVVSDKIVIANEKIVIQK